MPEQQCREQASFLLSNFIHGIAATDLKWDTTAEMESTSGGFIYDQSCRPLSLLLLLLS
jgi:hypothetical protein